MKTAPLNPTLKSRELTMRKSSVRGFPALLMALTVSSVWAQSSASSVADLIEAIKVQREMALSPGIASSRVKPGNSALADAENDPLVWSVWGMNDDYTAVLVIDRKVHTVKSSGLPHKTGSWRVRHISGQAVCLSQRGREVCLPAPNDAHMAVPFVKALLSTSSEGYGIPTAQNPVPAGGAGWGLETSSSEVLSQSLSSRLPVMPLDRGAKK